jgi:hypothetical protein
MPLFQRRRARATRQAAAVSGKPLPLGSRFPPEVRTKVVFAISDNTPAVVRTMLDIDWIDPPTIIRAMALLLVREWGRTTVTPDSLPDFLVRTATDDEVVDIIESWFPALDTLITRHEASSYVYTGPGRSAAHTAGDVLAGRYCETVNEILDDHDLVWQLVGQEMTPRPSLAMHATIIEPIMVLTSGEPRFAKVDTAYRDALRELKPGGSPSDAITDAATALQEALEALGAKGNALGPLLADARKRQLIAPYDSKLAAALDELGDWVSADRSARGDAHHVRDANRDDAWLAVRVAGALILRLAAGRQR